MDIRHCFVPYLPGILENETLRLNDKEIVRNAIESEPELSFQTREGEGRGEEGEGEGEIFIASEEEKMMEIKEGVKKEKEKKTEMGVEQKSEGTKNKVVEKVDKGVEKEVEKKVVIMAKHLCGVATDLALRSLDAFIIPTSTSTTTSTSTSTLKQGRDLKSNGRSLHNFIIMRQLYRNQYLKLFLPYIISNHTTQNNKTLFSLLLYFSFLVVLDSRVKGVAIATCCHHACVWEDYTGADWLLSQG